MPQAMTIDDLKDAEHVHTRTNGLWRGDDRFRSKALHLLPGGEWAILHRGGKMTDVAQWFTRRGHRELCGSQFVERIEEAQAVAMLAADRQWSILARLFENGEPNQ